LKIWRSALMATALFAAGLVACSTDDLIDADDVLDIDDGASDGIAKSLKVDGTSEKTLELETGAMLTVPKGAVDHELTIKVERPSDDKALDLVKTLKSEKAVASAPYVLTPHGTQFKSAVTLEIPVQKHEGRALAVAWLEDENDKEWKVLAEAPVQDGKVKVELQHFSVIVVLEPTIAGLDASVPASAADAGLGTPDAAQQGPRDEEDAGEAPPGRADAGVGSAPDAGGSTSQPQDAAAPVAVDAEARDPKYDDAGFRYDAGSGASADAGSAAGDAYVPDYDAYVPPYYDAYVPPYYDAYVPDYDAYVPPPPEQDAAIKR
jgi:hypothetical protein